MENLNLVQLDHSDFAYVMVNVFINIQLIINNCLSKGFPNQINEAFTKMYRYDVYILLLKDKRERKIKKLCLSSRFETDNISSVELLL